MEPIPALNAPNVDLLKRLENAPSGNTVVINLQGQLDIINRSASAAAQAMPEDHDLNIDEDALEGLKKLLITSYVESKDDSAEFIISNVARRLGIINPIDDDLDVLTFMSGKYSKEEVDIIRSRLFDKHIEKKEWDKAGTLIAQVSSADKKKWLEQVNEKLFSDNLQKTVVAISKLLDESERTSAIDAFLGPSFKYDNQGKLTNAEFVTAILIKVIQNLPVKESLIVSDNLSKKIFDMSYEIAELIVDEYIEVDKESIEKILINLEDHASLVGFAIQLSSDLEEKKRKFNRFQELVFSSTIEKADIGYVIKQLVQNIPENQREVLCDDFLVQKSEETDDYELNAMCTYLISNRNKMMVRHEVLNEIEVEYFKEDIMKRKIPTFIRGITMLLNMVPKSEHKIVDDKIKKFLDVCLSSPDQTKANSHKALLLAALIWDPAIKKQVIKYIFQTANEDSLLRLTNLKRIFSSSFATVFINPAEKRMFFDNCYLSLCYRYRNQNQLMFACEVTHLIEDKKKREGVLNDLLSGLMTDLAENKRTIEEVYLITKTIGNDDFAEEFFIKYAVNKPESLILVRQLEQYRLKQENVYNLDTEWDPAEINIIVNQKDLQKYPEFHLNMLAQSYSQARFLGLQPVLSVTFNNEEGVDAGGITRIYLSALSLACVGSKENKFHVPPDVTRSELFLPRIPDGQENLSPRQLLFYQDLGTLMGFCLYSDNEKSMTTGLFFDNALFALIFRLKSDEISEDYENLTFDTKLKLCLAYISAHRESINPLSMGYFEQLLDCLKVSKVNLEPGIKFLLNEGALEGVLSEAQIEEAANNPEMYRKLIQNLLIAQIDNRQFAPIHAIARGIKAEMPDSEWDSGIDILNTDFEESVKFIDRKIQGSLNREDLIEHLGLVEPKEGDPPLSPSDQLLISSFLEATKEFILDENTSQAEISSLISFATGSSSYSPSTKIQLKLFSTAAPGGPKIQFLSHTCFGKIDCFVQPDTEVTQEEFLAELKATISSPGDATRIV